MAAPAIMGIASVIGGVEGAYAENIWAAAMGWGGFMTYFIGIWFHEFFRGGPNEVDSLFSNYIGTSYVAFGVLGLMTAFAGYKTGSTSYPITFTANFGATVFGFWLTAKIDKLYGTKVVTVHVNAEEDLEFAEAAPQGTDTAAL